MPPATAITAGRTERGAAATTGSRRSTSCPRGGINAPRVIAAITIRSSGNALPTPVAGSHDASVCTSSRTDCTMPSPKAAAVVMAKEEKPPINAAASAGTISKVNVTGSAVTIGPASTPAPPASAPASAQLTAATRSGFHPVNASATSSSAAARLARPNRLNRYSAQAPAVATTTMPASHNRSLGRTTLPKCRGVDGRTRGTDTASAPYCNVTIACSATMTPTDARSRDNGGVARNGRNTAK